MSELVVDREAELDAAVTAPGRAFRPDIEGLRAVAVALVVLYHADISWLAGGYVGVDVFFVVSGFLITGLLVKDLARDGTFSLTTFYARRMRRLLPASVLVLVVTVVLMKLYAPPLSSVGFRGDAMATSIYVSNILFAIDQTSYLAASAPSPLLHYWSLAVEEQFYLVWPLLLLVAGRLGRGTLTRRLAIVIGTVGFASLALSIVLTARSQPWAFFLLPTRAWELAAGAALALSVGRLARLSPRVGAALAWAGLAAVTVAALTFDARTAFPGYTALLPVLGAAAVIAGGLVHGGPGAPARLLSLRPLQWVGARSYSIYLWHWPLLVIPALGRTGLSAATRAVLVVLGVVLGAITHRLIEDPVRNAPALVRSRLKTFALGGSLTAVALVAGFVGGVLPVLDAGRPASASPSIEPDFVPSDLRPDLRSAVDDLSEIWRNGCHADILSTEPKGCVYGAPDGDRTVVLFGDSHAAQWFDALDGAASRAGWRLVTLTKSACAALDVPTFLAELGRRYTECERWRETAVARIAEERDPIVIITNTRGMEPLDGRLVDVWEDGLRRTVAALPNAAEVIVLADTPRPSGSLPVCLSEHLRDASACSLPIAEALDQEIYAVEQRAARHLGVGFLDATELVCPNDPCAPIRDNLLVWRDEHHLSSAFSASLAEPIRRMLDALID